MAYFDWDKSYDVGVRDMNTEHQRLMALMNQLYDSNSKNLGKVVLAGQLGALAQFTREHFQHEESYLAASGYAELRTHKLIHADLLKKLDEHATDFSRSGKLSPAFFSFLKMWLSAHICGIDMKYAPKSVGKVA
jgi:hemerythrin